ncbi:MAG: urea carboxylase-associated family protein [Thermoleophilia bacterium]|nr:urea carboxylase-associated family protein [Thermoleophilia bacterium]
MSGRQVISETTIEPGTGKAFEVERGQVIRIEQVEGGQCADFNCFNLHDYKEYFHTGRTRHMHGLNPGVGDFLWSAPPRERPMAAIVADTTGTNDVLYARCSAFLFEYQYGLPVHTNCHDMQAEAQREYGLTPDDVHDSFNFFMNTGIEANGRPYIGMNESKRGDYVEVLALMDLLAVPNVCGADVMATSSFQLKPLKISILGGTDAELASFEERPELGSFTNQRTPADFKQSQIRVERELARDPSYVPEFTNVPIRLSGIDVDLDDSEAALLTELQATGEFGETEAEALRHVFHSWWISRYMRGPKHFESEPSQTA